MLSSISKLCNLTHSFFSSFYELGIFNTLEVKKYSLLSFLLSSIICLVNSKYKEELPGKDCICCFLNSSKFNWRRFFLEVFSNVTELAEPYRSKRTDMLSKIFDHLTHEYFNSYHLSLDATVRHLINDYCKFLK